MSKNKSLFNVDLVKIENIVITNARLENKTDITVLEKNKYEFDIVHTFSIAINIEERKLRVISSCQVKTLERNSKSEIGIWANFDIAFFFYIENLNELVVGAGPEFESNTDLIMALSNIAYSTSRGIIFTRCQGTIMKSLIMPIMSSEKIMEMYRLKEAPEKKNNSEL